MITQQDVDRLQCELEELRLSLLHERTSVLPRLEQLIDRAYEMKQNAAGGKFEHSISSVHGLLTSLVGNVQAQDRLNALH